MATDVEPDDLTTIASYFVRSYHFTPAEESRIHSLCQRTSTPYPRFRQLLRVERARVEEVRRHLATADDVDDGSGGDVLELARKDATTNLLLRLVCTADDGMEQGHVEAELREAVNGLNCSWVADRRHASMSASPPRTSSSVVATRGHQDQASDTGSKQSASVQDERTTLHESPRQLKRKWRAVVSGLLIIYSIVCFFATFGWTYYVNAIWTPSHFDSYAYNSQYDAADKVFLPVAQGIASIHPVLRNLTWSIDTMICDTWKTRKSLGCKESGLSFSCNTSLHVSSTPTLPFPGQQDRCDALGSIVKLYIDLGSQVGNVWACLQQAETDFEVFSRTVSKLDRRPSGLALFVSPIRTPTWRALVSPPHWLPLATPYAFVAIVLCSPSALAAKRMLHQVHDHDLARKSVRDAWRHTYTTLDSLRTSGFDMNGTANTMRERYRQYPDIKLKDTNGFMFPQEFVVGMGEAWQFQMTDELDAAAGVPPEAERDRELALVHTFWTLANILGQVLENSMGTVAKWERQGALVRGFTREEAPMAQQRGRKVWRLNLEQEWRMVIDDWSLKYLG